MNGLMGGSILVNGEVIKWMAMESLYSKMVGNILESGKMIKGMD